MRKSGTGKGMVRRRLAELVIVFDLTVDVPVTVIERFPEGAEGPIATLSVVVAEGAGRERHDRVRPAFTLSGPPRTDGGRGPVEPVRGTPVEYAGTAPAAGIPHSWG